ncbi:MAG: hypothetical protein LBS74_04560 [Oscillospiraceae bacterium]|jgi:hypothetical protein|nr:hypothetical protein [Oscillospiraceae bacterium]
MDDKAVLILRLHNRGLEADIEVPLSISANELVLALNAAYDLGIDADNVQNCYLKAENPIALLKGNKTLREYGMHSGSVINFTD